MEIAQLRSFCAIIEEQSYSKAAKKGFISQPAISMQIKALENGLDEKLIQRSRNRIVLTEAGKILYQHAKLILLEIDQAKQKIEEIKGLKRGHLRLGCSDTVSHYLLPPLLSDFLNKFPGMDVTIQNKPTSQTVEMLLDHTIDIGIVTLPVKSISLNIQVLFEYEEIAVSCAEMSNQKSGRMSFKQLVQHRLLVLERGTRSRSLLEAEFEKRGDSPESLMEFGSVDVQKKFAEIGFGVAIIPDFAIDPKLTESTLKTYKIKGNPKKQIGWAVRSNQPLPPITDAFLTDLTRFLADFTPGK